MAELVQTVRREVTLKLENGLHLHPISHIVRCAQSFAGSVSLLHNGKRADAKSAFDLMLLGAECGAVLTVEASGADAAAAAAGIVSLFESGFGVPDTAAH
ncbi:MAG: HPr family phosphocarrier protein [Planctomycetaceae bacterium]|jgi:phosphocarrier protein